MNRKGLVIRWMIFGVIIAVITFFLLLSQSDVLQTSITGEESLGYMVGVHEGQKLRIFEEQAGIIAAHRSMYDVALRGGFEKESKCGRYPDYGLGYQLWNGKDNDKECFAPLEKNTLLLAKSHLDKILPGEPSVSAGNIELVFSGSKLAGVSTSPLKQNVFPLRQGGGATSGAYVFSPSFIVDTDRHIHDQERLTKTVQSVLACRSAENKNDCVNTVVDENKASVQEGEELHWQSGSCPSRSEEETYTNFVHDIVSCRSAPEKNCWCDLSTSQHQAVVTLTTRSNDVIIRGKTGSFILASTGLVDEKREDVEKISLIVEGVISKVATPLDNAVITKNNNKIGVEERSKVSLEHCSPAPLRQFCVSSNQEVIVDDGGPVQKNIEYRLALDLS